MATRYGIGHHRGGISFCLKPLMLCEKRPPGVGRSCHNQGYGALRTSAALGAHPIAWRNFRRRWLSAGRTPVPKIRDS